MKPPDFDPYAYPPRGFSRQSAARYLGISQSNFDDLVRFRKLPRPRKLNGQRVWDRYELNAAFGTFPMDSDTMPAVGMPLDEPKPHPNVYTPDTLAERWQCSGNHIRKLIHEGRLPAFKSGGRLLRIKVTDVIAYEAGQALEK